MTLLNPDQERRVVTHVALLRTDLEGLARSPDLARPIASHARVREAVADAARSVEDLRRALDLAADPTPSLGRRIAAVAEVWAARVEDLRAARLQAYGVVHPELAARLDPHVAAVRRSLEQLADAAATLPEHAAEGDPA